MSWGPTDNGAFLTGVGKWNVHIVGDQVAMSVGDQPAVKVHLLNLAHLDVKQGFVWATCNFRFRTSQGVVERKVDGIPNARAVSMADSIESACIDTIANLVSSHAALLDAWIDRAVAILTTLGSNLTRDHIADALARASAPRAPEGISWDQVLGHPLAMRARKVAKRWPTWEGTPSQVVSVKAEAICRGHFTSALADWIKAFAATYLADRWAPKGAAARFIAANPAPIWSGRPWDGAMKALCTSEQEAPRGSMRGLLSLLMTSEVEDLGHGVSHEMWKSVTRGTTPAESLSALIGPHNAAYLDHQRLVRKQFFESVEKNPLTDEQIHACICMDEAVMVVAAAGSGKTSTMVAKTGYALEEGLATPEQILLLAFNRVTANELGGRIAEQLNHVRDVDKVRSNTFHAFGIEVIAKATGKKPSLAPWLDPNKPGEDIREVSNIIEALCAENSQFNRDWDLFRIVYGRDVGKRGQRQEPDAYASGKRGFLTAQGDIVKSKEERVIADWLYYSGVKYEYERAYEHDTASEQHRQYFPDFFYPDAQLYHEHFALDENGEAPEDFDGYLQGVEWKRQIHAEKGTAFVETTSHALSTGEWVKTLERALVKRGVRPKFDPTRPSQGLPPVPQEDLARSFRVFQQHVKNNGLSHRQLHAALKEQSEDGFGARLRLYLSLYECIAAEWERRLWVGKFIDFEDMLIQAAEYVETGAYESPYTIILADEFQDSSRARIRLLKALAANPPVQTHLCVVGDDWQGINRFAGSDISVMTEFEKTFEHATRLTLNTTFRCPQELCHVSSEFIQANPAQIKKTVQTTNPLAKTPMLAFGFQQRESIPEHVEQQLADAHRYATEGKLVPLKGAHITILLLGRYRDDAPAALERWQRRFGDRLKIEFRTAHGSKGLEAEYVFVLNVLQGTRGFPSQIQDDPALQLAMPAPDPFPFAEERRLFYVAMTRARKQVRFYTTLGQPSQFLVELVRAGHLEIEPVDGEPLETCPQCGCGVLQIKGGVRGSFRGCSRFPSCDYALALSQEDARDARSPVSPSRLPSTTKVGDGCPVCEQGVILQKHGKNGPFLACSRFRAGCRATGNIH